MNTAGFVFLIAAWASIGSLVAFCYYKVLSEPDTTYEHPEKTQGPGSAPGA